MFWDDIKDIKILLDKLNERVSIIEQNTDIDRGDRDDSLHLVHDKLTHLMNESRRLEQVELSQKILDKFEDYMKNVDKLNEMVNEFKGCVSIARAAIADKKELDDMRSVLK